MIARVIKIADLRLVRQQDFIEDDILWKIYWWGGHRDEALVKRLRLEKTLQQVADPTGKVIATGFQEAEKDFRKRG